MRLAIGSDHAGVDLKDVLVTALTADGHEVLDLGTHGHESVDYPTSLANLQALVGSG